MLLRFAFALVSMAALLVHPYDGRVAGSAALFDLNSPEMSTSEMTRAEVDSLLKAWNLNLARTDVMRFFWRCAGRAVGLNPGKR